MRRAVLRSVSQPDTPSVAQSIRQSVQSFASSVAVSQFNISICNTLVSHLASQSVRQSVRQTVSKSPSRSLTTGYLHWFSQSVTQSIHQSARLVIQSFSQSVGHSVNPLSNCQIFYLLCLYFYWLPIVLNVRELGRVFSWFVSQLVYVFHLTGLISFAHVLDNKIRWHFLISLTCSCRRRLLLLSQRCKQLVLVPANNKFHPQFPLLWVCYSLSRILWPQSRPISGK